MLAAISTLEEEAEDERDRELRSVIVASDASRIRGEEGGGGLNGLSGGRGVVEGDVD